MKIMLVCAQGMSTSMLVKKMQEYSTANNIEADIFAIGNGQIQDYISDVDIILLGPQIRFRKKSIEELVSNRIPVVPIEMVDYGTMNGEAVMKKVLVELKK